MRVTISSADAMMDFGAAIGALLKGGEVLELIGDIGAGKTTFTKGLAKGLAISDDVQSPTFTLSRVYESPKGITLVHYDFYRLSDPGIMRVELEESVHTQRVVTVVEWSSIVADVLPERTVRMTLQATDENTRQVTIEGADKTIEEALRDFTME